MAKVKTHDPLISRPCVTRPREAQPETGARLGERVDELDALATFLHADIERYKTAIARQLHDELAGSVIAAMMDVAWIEEHEASVAPPAKMRFGRIKDSLREAIGLARRMVEELRPTLLDSIGLFAALSWQFKRGCERAKVNYVETYPSAVAEMDMSALIALFRIAQEAFSLLIQHQGLSEVRLSIETTDNAFIMRLSGDGTPPPTGVRSAVLSSMLHRTRNIGGKLSIMVPPSGGSSFQVSLPQSAPQTEPVVGRRLQASAPAVAASSEEPRV
jgi:signal transduction histidine kinase